MYFLDTNHCSRIISGDQQVIQAAFTRRSEGVSISVIVQGELLFMAEYSERKAENIARVQSFLGGFDIYPINSEVSNTYASLKAKLLDTFGPQDKAKRRRTRIQAIGFDDNDLWIAATAIQYDLLLVSSDSDFDRIQQVEPLKVESWILG
jgi:tRNA(fMet)-specific endonuclease VapC